MTLLKKFKLAKYSLVEAKSAYIGVENSLNTAVVNWWKDEEKVAMEERGVCLRIFEVRQRNLFILMMLVGLCICIS
jgi:hypothetical protein